MFWFFPPKKSKTHWKKKTTSIFPTNVAGGKTRNTKGRMKLAPYLLPYTEICFKQTKPATKKTAGGKQEEAL